MSMIGRRLSLRSTRAPGARRSGLSIHDYRWLQGIYGGSGLWCHRSSHQPVTPSGEEAVSVRRAFARLTTEEQEALELRVIAGLSAQEVAAVQGRRSGAVRMAQHRAIGPPVHAAGDAARHERATQNGTMRE
jgi:Sigma-70, region 4